MAESQSRYGIMEELNKRKIAEKEALAELERKTDDTIYNTEKQIEDMKNLIDDKQGKYKREYQNWKRNKELQLSMLTADFDRQKDNFENEISEKEENYENDFLNWKEAQERELNKSNESLSRFKKQQSSKITQKKAVIDEIEKGVESLKEMSSEQVHKKE